MPIVNFWIVKGNPRYPIPGVEERCGDIASFLRARPWSDWITYRAVPPDCRIGDPVFFWSSGKLRSIVGLGLIRNPSIDGHEFHLTHLTRKIFSPEQQLNIQEIRQAFDDELSESERDKALYIKPSVVATIYQVRPFQAKILIRLLLEKNPDNKYLRKWNSLFPAKAAREKTLSFD